MILIIPHAKGADRNYHHKDGGQTAVGMWEGDRDLKTTLGEEKIITVGSAHLIRTMSAWFQLSAYAHIRPATGTTDARS